MIVNVSEIQFQTYIFTVDNQSCFTGPTNRKNNNRKSFHSEEVMSMKSKNKIV